jgi:hypothetical protein
MKKTAFVFVLFCCTSLFAAASQRSIDPGNPRGHNQQQPTFALSSGYFSFFGLFSFPAPAADTTTKTIVPNQRLAVPEDSTKPKS